MKWVYTIIAALILLILVSAQVVGIVCVGYANTVDPDPEWLEYVWAFAGASGIGLWMTLIMAGAAALLGALIAHDKEKKG